MNRHGCRTSSCYFILFAAFLLLCIVGLYGPAVAQIGFISDDWDLLKGASKTSIWHPIEGHHWSLVLNLLFKGAAEGVISPASFHILAIVFHFINSLLMFYLGIQCLKWPPLHAMIATVLFAVSPAGVEAMVWCCSIGYVLCTTMVLLALLLFLQRGVSIYWQAIGLLIIQLSAFVIWDWGMIITPVILAAAISTRRWNMSVVLPMIIGWVVVLMLKKVYGQSYGYLINSPLQMLKNTMSAPFLALFPQFTKQFYTSVFGVICSITCLLLMAYVSFKEGSVRLMTAIFFASQLPQIVLGYPQSRYFYLPSFAMAFVVVGILSYLTRKTVCILCSLIFVGLFAFWTSERIALWEEASEQAEEIRVALQQLVREKGEIVVVNLPDRYGPSDMIWKPFLWRCGLGRLGAGIEQIHTTDCKNVNPEGKIPSYSRQELAQQYHGKQIYEIVYKKPEDYRSVEIQPFK